MVFKVVGFQLCIKFSVLEVVEQFLEKILFQCISIYISLFLHFFLVCFTYKV